MAEATAARPEPARQDSQFDFSGGANGFRKPLLLAPNEAQDLLNCFPRPGGGIEFRDGFKFGPALNGTSRGVAIFEMDQSTGTILTYQDVGAAWYDETMQARFRLFEQTPRVNDAVYFGSREKFFQLQLYLSAAYVPASATHVLVYEYWNGSAWTDFTANVTGTDADAKKLASSTLPKEVILSWPELATWTPNQVETRSYQYWIRIRVTVDLQNGGSDVVQSRRRILGDWVGRRLLICSDQSSLWDLPGLTLTPRSVGSGFSTAVTAQRVNGAMLNDFFYYAQDGLSPLKRWGGGRGTVRSGAYNTPVDAGLTAPSAAPTTAGIASATSYPAAYVIRHMISFEYGPGSILGESPPSAASTAYTILAGGEKVRVTFTAAKTQAATLEVNAIRIYATRNLVNVTATNDQIDPTNFELIKTVYRDDADWVAGYWDDTYAKRQDENPITYTNTPPFYPKYVVAGGERLWIANDTTVACSDVGRGDSWNPTNQWWFPTVRGILYWGGQLIVWGDEDIHFIRGVNVQSPESGYVWRGIGCVQPDTICVHENEVHWVSHRGPARLRGNEYGSATVELTAKNRVWEGTAYWNKVASQRRLASAAAFDGRVWFGIDGAGAGPGLAGTAALDLRENPEGAWTRHIFRTAAATYAVFGTLAVVHCPLDHALARQRILVGFADASYTSDYKKLAILSYGTTDNWTTSAYDGQTIAPRVKTRAIALQAVDRMKAFEQAHVRYSLRRQAASGIYIRAFLQSLTNQTFTKFVYEYVDTVDNEKDLRFFPTEDSGPSRFRDEAPYIQLDAVSDLGGTISSWLVRGTVEPFKV